MPATIVANVSSTVTWTDNSGNLVAPDTVKVFDRVVLPVTVRVFARPVAPPTLAVVLTSIPCLTTKFLLMVAMIPFPQ